MKNILLLLLFCQSMLLSNSNEITINLSQYLQDFYSQEKRMDILQNIQNESREKCNFTPSNELICVISHEALKEIIDDNSIKGLSIFTVPKSMEFGGIGVSIHKNKESQDFKIVKIFNNSPAQKAHLKLEDTILEIDGIKAENLTLDSLIEKLRGKPNSKVDLLILRENQKISKTIFREIIRVNDDEMIVSFHNKELTIAIESFDKRFSNKLEKILLQKPHQKLILDLRNSNGGIMDEILQTLELFLPTNQNIFYNIENVDKHIYSINGKKNIEYTNDIEIIVDETTHAGSILFAYAMNKYYKNCKIIGNDSGEIGYLYMVKELPESLENKLFLMKIPIGEFFTMNDKILSGKKLFEVLKDE